MPERKSKVMGLEDAVKLIEDGSTVFINGSHSNNAPMAMVREIIRHRRRNLTIIPTPSTGLLMDMLIAAGCVKTCYVSYVGLEFLGFAQNFRKAAESKSVELIEADEAQIVYGLRAGAGGLPFVVVPPIHQVTDIPKVNPNVKAIVDPYTGRTVTALPALRPEVGIVHVQQCDEYGNARALGGNHLENIIAKASDRLIVTTEEIIQPEETQADPLRTTIPGYLVHAVVRVPYGAHPTSCHAVYRYDEDHLRLYAEYSKGKTSEYLDTWVYGPKDYYAYLEMVGIEKLLNLRLK